MITEIQWTNQKARNVSSGVKHFSESCLPTRYAIRARLTDSIERCEMVDVISVKKCLFYHEIERQRNTGDKGNEVSNVNRAEWSPIRSVNIQVITKSDGRAAAV